jgi:hypothetical protein
MIWPGNGVSFSQRRHGLMGPPTQLSNGARDNFLKGKWAESRV